MKWLDRTARALAIVLFVVIGADARAEGLSLTQDDGWHSWRVTPSESGGDACCYDWRHGDAKRGGCNLDSGDGQYVLGDCETLPADDTVVVYARIEDGQVRRIRALSADCPVKTALPVMSSGRVDNAASVAWLTKHIGDSRRLADDAMAAISMHAGDAAVAALIAVVEDRDRRRKQREQALFWLAQSGSDEALDYFDNLFSENRR